MKLINQSISGQMLSQSLKALQNPSKVLKDKGATMEIYQAVACQPDIFAAAQNYEDAILNMEFSATDAFVQEYLLQSGVLEQLVRCAVSARNYGFAVGEITQYGEFNGKTVPLHIDLCPPEKFLFDTDRVLRLKQQGNPIGIDVMKQYPNKFILLQNKPTYANPYGIALYDIAYWLAVGLNGNFEFMLRFAEQDGTAKWLATVPPDTPETKKQEILLEMAKLAYHSQAIVEEGTGIEPKEPGGRSSSTDLFKQVNEMLLRKVEKLFYGTDLTMQVEGKGGYSSSQTGMGIREDALSQGKRLCTKGIQNLIAYVANINGGEWDNSITITSPGETTKEEAETDQIYFGMGLKPTKAFFNRRGYGDNEFNLSEATGQEQPKQSEATQKPADFSGDSLSDIFDLFKKELAASPKK